MNNQKTMYYKSSIQKAVVHTVFRRIFSGLLVLGIALSSVLFSPVTVKAQDWENLDGKYRMPDGTPIEGAVARGIDVSYWKQEVDWEQVADSDVDFAMLGTRFRGEVDPYFPVNAQKAREAGLEVGAYIYSYATTVEMAEQEADIVLDLVKDFEISFPIAFDVEDNATLGTLTPQQVSESINAFCGKFEEAGYYPMLYANEYWLNNKIDLSMVSYDLWVARYNTMYTVQNPSMWQATNTGAISGVNGSVDINFLFTDYSFIIPANTWRVIAGNRYYYQNHKMQKESWIHDGINWYYMSAAGNPETGWKQINGVWYYLDLFGAMQTGWQQINGLWYYLDLSGAMQTGWQQVNGLWYYLDSSGAMQTGWQQINGVWYYLDSSGAMQTDWQQIDGQIYYFDPAGGQMINLESLQMPANTDIVS